MNFKKYERDTCIPLTRACSLGEIELATLARLEYPGKHMTDDMLKGVNSIGYWDAHIQQNWGLNWHRNGGIEITYLETGTLDFETEGQNSTTLRANDLTIMRPWQLHKLGNPNINIGRLYWIILDVEVRNPHQVWEWPDWIVLSKKDMNELTNMLRQNEQTIWRAHPKIGACFREIGKAVKEDILGSSESKLTIQINSLLLNILKLFRTGDISLDKTLIESKRSANLFLKELPLYINKNWTLETMAEHCNLGTTRFVHFCKIITNMTPTQYLNHLRLVAASEMLEKYPDKRIQHIAYDCGYTSTQYFATQFKKRYGSSPKFYRQKHILNYI